MALKSVSLKREWWQALSLDAQAAFVAGDMEPVKREFAIFAAKEGDADAARQLVHPGTQLVLDRQAVEEWARKLKKAKRGKRRRG